MKNILFNIFSLALIISFVSCDYHDGVKGSGNKVDREESLSEFNSVEFKGNYVVYLHQADQYKVIIEADDNLMSYIDVKQSGNKVSIDSEENFYDSDDVRIDLYFKDIRDINVSGAVNLKNEGTLVVETLNMDLGGAGAINLTLESKDVNIEVSGAGGIKLKGFTEFLGVRMSGAGGMDAKDLTASNAELDISGVGGAQVCVRDVLKAEISGIGGVQYYCKPNEIIENIAGLGSIKEGNSDKDDTDF
ncbi:head GIN domain-containing protein [Marinigracilibium pacificum]|uniref:DUF2807 domain-containing protein n=1 Tax=Marinigracilibium pacificum TaxID=2729599 RepID=A0A848IUT0_9BACT|nr:head GIN domain-containing protein [Marinigracilibium pacificum]NMM46948.1 DUF2807 domain-containing protein [Marinigracilibium pacificum]